MRIQPNQFIYSKAQTLLKRELGMKAFPQLQPDDALITHIVKAEFEIEADLLKSAQSSETFGRVQFEQTQKQVRGRHVQLHGVGQMNFLGLRHRAGVRLQSHKLKHAIIGYENVPRLRCIELKN